MIYLLIKAMENGHVEVERYLLEQGMETFEDHEVLRKAAQNGHLEAVRLYLDFRAYEQNRNYWALTEATKNNRLEVAKLLLERYTDKTAEDLNYILRYVSNGKIAKLLPDAGANEVNLTRALEQGNADVVKVLLDAGADLSKVRDQVRWEVARKAYTWPTAQDRAYARDFNHPLPKPDKYREVYFVIEDWKKHPSRQPSPDISTK
jgi:ankyrin repeat protein